MTTIEGSKLIASRLKAAALRVEEQREEIKDLKSRLRLVEMHNEELQELFNKLSADQKALDEAIASSMENLDTSFENNLNAEENDEIESAESFGIDSEDSGEDDFFGDDF